MSVAGRLPRLSGKIGLARRGWATAVGFGVAGTRSPKPLEEAPAQPDDRAEGAPR